MRCFVVGCANGTTSGSFLSYHSFPKDNQLRVEWLRRIGRELNHFIVYKTVCSDHFSKDCFTKESGKQRLIRGALPTHNLPERCTEMFHEDLVKRLKPELASLSGSLRIPDLAKIKIALTEDDPSLPSTSSAHGVKLSEVTLSPATSLATKSPASTSSSVKRRMIKTFHNYSLSPGHYKKEIVKGKQKVNLLNTKLRNVKKTSLRRGKKITSLKQIVFDSKKKFVMSTDALNVLASTVSVKKLQEANKK